MYFNFPDRISPWNEDLSQDKLVFHIKPDGLQLFKSETLDKVVHP